MSYALGLKELLVMALSSPPAFQGCSVPPLPLNAHFPYIVIREIGGPDMTTLEGRNGLARKVMQVECWDARYEAAWALRQLVKGVLVPLGSTGYKGAAGDETILGVTHAADTSLYDAQRELHQLISSYLIWFEATT